MKTLKYLFYLLILILLVYLGYENQEFLMSKTSLKMNLKYKELVIPEVQNLAYFGICFFLGLLIVAVSSFSTKRALRKQISEKDDTIADLSTQVKELSTELEFFKNDPYIKNGLSNIEENIEADTTVETETQVTEEETPAIEEETKDPAQEA